MDLTLKKCLPCKAGVSPLTAKQAKEYLAQVPGWEANSSYTQISREFKFRDFKESMIFVNRVADLAEAEGHHPDIGIWYDTVQLRLWTHAVSGLSENDFILAAKIGRLI